MLEYTNTKANYSASLLTHIDDPVLGFVGVGATHIQPVVAHGLNHTDVVAALEVLKQREHNLLVQRILNKAGVLAH